MPATPTTYEEAKRLALESRARMIERYEQIAEQERMHRAHLRSMLRKHWWQIWRDIGYVRLDFPFDVLVDRNCATDAIYQTYVGDVQWFLNWASMFAQGEQRDELRALSTQLAVPVRTPRRSARTDDPPAPPPQRMQRS